MQEVTGRQERVLELRRKGLSYQKIGYLLGLSRQRIHQLLSGYKSPKNDHLYNYIRDAVLERDGHHCQLCNSTENLIVHHIDGSDLHNSLNNLITLCAKCHQLDHSTKRGMLCIQCGAKIASTKPPKKAYVLGLCHPCYTSKQAQTFSEFQCRTCGKHFKVGQHEVNRRIKEEIAPPRFCSRTCYFKAKRGRNPQAYREFINKVS